MSIGAITDPGMNYQNKDYGFLFDTNGHTFIYLKDKISQYFTHGPRVIFEPLSTRLSFNTTENEEPVETEIQVDLGIILRTMDGFQTSQPAFHHFNTMASDAIKKLPEGSRNTVKNFELVSK